MLCPRCRSLSPVLRRHPVGAPAPAAFAVLRGLGCERCGAPLRANGIPSLAEMLARLERAGLGIAGPLLRGPRRAA